nr:Pyridoxine/pyridoxamine 5'-phosphate oxidase [Ipomoea batatas]
MKDGDTIECFTLGDLWDCYEARNGVYMVNQKENEDVASIEGEKKDESSNNERDGTSIERNKDCCDKPSSEAEQHGHLYFQICDTLSPYWRIPFIEKIAELAEVHPGLMTFKTTDLSPASWISVAWYPIYQIPTKGNHKDRLSTCFLTYHALSSSSIRGVQLAKDGDKKGKKVLEMVKGEEGNNNIKKSTGDVLYPYPFGLATYRLDEIWINGNTFDDYKRIIDLYNAAECWLKRLNVWHHHDFNFFTSKLSLQGLSI